MSFLSDDEIQKLILVLAAGQGEAEFTQPDIDKVLDWANDVRMSAGILDNLLKGYIAVSIVDGELAFRITEYRTKYVEEKLLKGGK